ncbi:MAG: flagellar filament capping protein FliD [Alphaproteobacteria bacterium]|jgi:flagellar hook-associated protein 2|nr:flagellar filament capping protein FliD [Alphaproteobacteria bacterium]MCB1551621.1 flagellar filament capping protein FliD [Alphaproteobacteria bacterium]MCB9984105.1 flagellar filament capping protein FliD [Micavibrio sp.]HRK96954.1 flagellar filament capping protein FliD [Alphaproteobacteria bacterium]
MATNGITTLGTRTFLFGGSSGIDTSALIEAAYNQRKAEADKIDIKVSGNTDRIAALSTLQDLGSSIQNSLSSLKKNYSVLASKSSFDARTGTLSSSSSTTPTSLLSVAIAPGTDLGSFDIEVQQKAQAHKVGGNNATVDKNADLTYTGTFDIGVVGGTSVSINVTSDMSLSELATAITAQKGTTGVTASVLKTSESGYQLILSSVDTNKQIEVTNITGNDVLQNVGVLDGGGGFVNELQTAQGAIIVVDNVAINRDDNDFTDVLDGISLNVLNAEPGTTLQLAITTDTSSVKGDILDFVDSYNALRDFILSQQAVSNGETDAVLFGDSLLKTMGSSLQALVATSYGASGGNYETLAEIGLKVNSDGTITVDEEVLDLALLDKFDQVRDIFETTATFDNTQFRAVANTSQTKSFSFAMDITYSGGAITDVSIGGDNTLFNINGTLLQGKAGTAYEGLSFAYVGTSNATVNIDISQGFADMMNSALEDYTSVTSGVIQNEKISLDEQNTDLQARAARVLERADDFRNRLIDKYAQFEAQISAAQTILAQIRAILNINDSNN